MDRRSGDIQGKTCALVHCHTSTSKPCLGRSPRRACTVFSFVSTAAGRPCIPTTIVLASYQRECHPLASGTSTGRHDQGNVADHVPALDCLRNLLVTAELSATFNQVG